jgi:hypothetical protein
MQQAITDRIQTARNQIRDWRTARLDEIDEKRQTLVARKDEAVDTLITKKTEAVDTLIHKKDEAVDGAKERLITVQATVLENARDLLGWAGDQIGPRAEFVKRGEEALEEALVALRAGHSATLPIDGFDGLSVKKAVAALDAGEFDGIALRTLRAYEAANKARKTMLADLDGRLADLVPAVEEEIVAEAAGANEPTPLEN